MLVVVCFKSKEMRVGVGGSQVLGLAGQSQLSSTVARSRLTHKLEQSLRLPEGLASS